MGCVSVRSWRTWSLNRSLVTNFRRCHPLNRHTYGLTQRNFTAASPPRPKSGGGRPSYEQARRFFARHVFARLTQLAGQKPSRPTIFACRVQPGIIDVHYLPQGLAARLLRRLPREGAWPSNAYFRRDASGTQGVTLPCTLDYGYTRPLVSRAPCSRSARRCP